MPQKCPVCTKPCHSSQIFLQCTECFGWIHHDNRLKCSGLTDAEYEEHINDIYKPFKCDHCVSEFISKANNTIFQTLPFPVECEDNIFGKPPVLKCRNDVSSMSTSELNKFVKQCKNIESQFNISDNENEDEFFNSMVNSKYYTINELNKLKSDKTSSFRLAHVNIASLDAHIDDLRTVLSRLKFSFDIIGISEHKIMKDSSPSNNVDILGYDEFKFVPTETSFGGTGFYIKSDVDYIVRDDLEINSKGNCEAMFIEIILPNRKNLIVGCVYRHGSGIPIRDFTSKYLEPIMEKIGNEKKECMLMGDFNVDLLKTTDNNAAGDFYNMFSSYFFTPFVLQPSRLRSKTLIDNIFFNSLEYSSFSGNLLYELSDHLTQFLILEGFAKERSLPEFNMFKRNYKNFHEAEFEETVINGINWEEICMFRLRSPDVSVKNFFDTLNFHLDEMAPFEKVTLKQYKLMLKPWITPELLKKCDERNILLKSIKEESDPIVLSQLRIQYKNLRNLITDEKKRNKKAHFAEKFIENKDNSSKIWKEIRSLVNLKPVKSSTIKILDENQNITSDSQKIANIFNEHYATLGSKVQQKIPTQEGDFNYYLDKRDKNGKRFINPDGCTFYLSPVGPSEVDKIIDELNVKKSTGPFGIPVFLLKKFKIFFSFWLSQLVNLSFETGIFPDVLKVAKVNPLHKKESKINHHNYRPISLLSVISKIFEKLIYKRIYFYLDQKKLIYSKQFGFRANYSTNHAIISLTEHIRELLDKGNYVCGVFVDLEKAFDTVHHDILCDKIKAYGLRGNVNDLLKSYLSNRKQYVSINGFDSDQRNVTCGVPQGSSLGPLLFLIYINDFYLCLSQASCGHFADDTFIIYNSKKAKTIETVVNTELKEVIKWLRLNKLSLNAGKTELIFFHSSRHTLDYDKVFINFNGVRLVPVDYIKYLGMLIDKNLNWKYHVNNLCKQLSRANGVLSKLRYNAPLDICLQVYYSIFFSHLTYGCNLWGLTYDENISKIEVLQIKCVHIMSFAPFNAHTNELFINLGLIKTRDLISMYQLKLVYDFLNHHLPSDLNSLFQLSRDVQSTSLTLNSTYNRLLHIPKVNTSTYGLDSIKFQCPKLWNNIFKSGEIQIDDDKKKNIKLSGIKSKKGFNFALKKHFLHSYTVVLEVIYY